MVHVSLCGTQGSDTEGCLDPLTCVHPPKRSPMCIIRSSPLISHAWGGREEDFLIFPLPINILHL